MLSLFVCCVGWDPRDGGSVYALPLGGSLVKQDWAIGGSGSTYIYGFCDAYYKRNMTKDECLVFVRKALAHAMARDGSSGGVIRTVVIDQNGVDRSFVPGDELPFKPEVDVARQPGATDHPLKAQFVKNGGH
jgi:20S proteasome subunit beta 1